MHKNSLFYVACAVISATTSFMAAAEQTEQTHCGTTQHKFIWSQRSYARQEPTAKTRTLASAAKEDAPLHKKK